MNKFSVSKPTIYSILEEYEIPKLSELRNNEKDDDLDLEYPFIDANGNKSERLVYNLSGSSNEYKEDEIGNDLKNLVVYSDLLVKYAKNLKEFTNIIQDVNNEQRELQQINKLLESTDILEFLKPNADNLNQSNSERRKDTEKPLIDTTFLLMVANPNIPPESKNALIYGKVFTLISRMKPEDFNLQINPKQTENFIKKYNELLKVKKREV